jgi:hypothetical protein
MPNSIDLTAKYLRYTDERFTEESRRALVTNDNFSWDGAQSVKIYTISTAPMNDYGREQSEAGNWSRYGAVMGLDAVTQTMVLSQDRSFTFALDKLDMDETGEQLAAQSALDRQLREVVFPEVEAYIFGKICACAGHTPDPTELTPDSIYDEIINGSNALDNASVPDKQRLLIVTPDTMLLMKRCKDLTMNFSIDNEFKQKGLIATLDGLGILRVPKAWLPADYGFMITHSIATVAPVKLNYYGIHRNPPGINGALVEGRIAYDAFVLNNKKSAIYYQSTMID